jgi:hypothetical protein
LNFPRLSLERALFEARFARGWRFRLVGPKDAHIRIPASADRVEAEQIIANVFHQQALLDRRHAVN